MSKELDNLLDNIMEDIKGKKELRANVITIDMVPEGFDVTIRGSVYNALTVEDREHVDTLIAKLAMYLDKGITADKAKMEAEKQPTCEECGNCENKAETDIFQEARDYFNSKRN